MRPASGNRGRAAEPNGEPARKRPKKSSVSPEEAAPATGVDVARLARRARSLEAAVRESKANLNGVVELLELCESDHAEARHAAVHALHRVFMPLLEKSELVREKEEKNNRPEGNAKPTEKAPETGKPTVPGVSSWLRDNYLQYIDVLIGLLSSPEPGLQVPALNLLMDIFRREAAFSARLRNGEPEFPNYLYKNMVAALVYNANFTEHLRECLVEKYLVIYDDLRFFMYKDLTKVVNGALAGIALPTSVRTPARAQPAKLANVAKMETVTDNVFTILDCFRSMPTEQSEVDSFWTGHPRPALNDQVDEDSASEYEHFAGDVKSKRQKPALPALLLLSAHRRVFSDAWLAFLRLPLPVELYKRVLLIMHKKIIPHMPRPTVLIDFLTDSYNEGGVVSLLALNGLFTLIDKHNLDYPEFYTKLYALLDVDVMHVKYRSRFFRMLDLFLTSTHLPAYVVAAFVKRLARLSLAAPPAADVVIMALVYNLLKRHPTLMKLIHRPQKGGLFAEDTECTEYAGGPDPYDPQERNPAQCRALDSSLWELVSLRSHYAPNVSSLAKMFEEKFNKPGYALEDFLDHTYATMFEADVSRPPKKTPPVAIEAQPGLTEEAAGYSDIWAFT